MASLLDPLWIDEQTRTMERRLLIDAPAGSAGCGCTRLVIARHRENVSWALGLGIPLDVVDKQHGANVGRESLSFLQFIIEHYHRLPATSCLCFSQGTVGPVCEVLRRPPMMPALSTQLPFAGTLPLGPRRARVIQARVAAAGQTRVCNL